MSKRNRTRINVPFAIGLVAGVPSCRAPDPAAQVTVVVVRDHVAAPPVPSPDVVRAQCLAGPLLSRLRAASVDRRHYAVRTLYTWTTAEQAAKLREGGPLLVRATSPTHGVSVYDVVLQNLARRGNRIAAILQEPRFQKARFAWKTPWPTLLGWEGETYGDRLLRVTLRADAWVLRVSTLSSDFEAVDLGGEPVALADVVAHPERIGAVYFAQDANPRAGTYLNMPMGDMGRFREYVLPNEPMIESWEMGTRGVATSLDESFELAGEMRAWLGTGCARGESIARYAALDGVWELASDADDPALAYGRALSIGSSRYAPMVSNLDALIEALRAVPRGEAYVGRPSRVVERVPVRTQRALEGPRGPTRTRPGTFARSFWKP